MTLTTHPGCGCATFAFVSKDGQKITPLPRFMDVDGFFENVETMIEKYRDARFSRVRTAVAGARLLHDVAKYFDFSKAPGGVNGEELRPKVIASIFTEGNKEAVAKFTWRTLYIGNMHFQDAYDYDIQRLMRCDIHYAVPDGRIIPFCSYNSGPIYRTEVEKKFSIPIPDWQAAKKQGGAALKTIETMGVNGEVIVDPEYYQRPGAQGRPRDVFDVDRPGPSAANLFLSFFPFHPRSGRALEQHGARLVARYGSRAAPRGRVPRGDGRPRTRPRPARTVEPDSGAGRRDAVPSSGPPPRCACRCRGRDGRSRYRCRARPTGREKGGASPGRRCDEGDSSPRGSGTARVAPDERPTAPRRPGCAARPPPRGRPRQGGGRVAGPGRGARRLESGGVYTQVLLRLHLGVPPGPSIHESSARSVTPVRLGPARTGRGGVRPWSMRRRS